MFNLKMVKIEQSLDDTKIKNLKATIITELQKVKFENLIQKGATVAILAGSRGISNLTEIIALLVQEVKNIGATPIIIPAMGSHGGATAEGQKEVLSELGITEAGVGAEVVSSMETIELIQTASGIPVHIDRTAFDVDHIVVVNRIKPHTEYFGKTESGLIKMMAIGLGKHNGAICAHNYAVKFGYEKTLAEIGQAIIEQAPVALGIALLENGYGQTAAISAILPTEIYTSEQQILEEARLKTPKLPFSELDILIVDEIGKEISGTGMDTKVIGRIANIYEPELDYPRITRIMVRNLTDQSHGNAIGVGLADFITQKLRDKIDLKTTYINSITAVTPEKGCLPIVCENDREALEFAVATAGPINAKNARVAWIKNSSKLGEMHISEGLVSEVQRMSNVRIVSEPLELAFDEQGDLKTPA